MYDSFDIHGKMEYKVVVTHTGAVILNVLPVLLQLVKKCYLFWVHIIKNHEIDWFKRALKWLFTESCGIEDER